MLRINLIQVPFLSLNAAKLTQQTYIKNHLILLQVKNKNHGVMLKYCRLFYFNVVYTIHLCAESFIC